MSDLRSLRGALYTPPKGLHSAKRRKTRTGNTRSQYADLEATLDDDTIREGLYPHGEPYDCVCGKKDDVNDGLACVCCTACTTWQHNECLILPIYEEDIPEDFVCPRCMAGYMSFDVHILAAKAFMYSAEHDDVPFFEQNRRRHQILNALAKVDWFWHLAGRLTPENVALMKQGKKLKNKQEHTITVGHRIEAERGAQALLDHLDIESVKILRNNVLSAGTDRTAVYKVLLQAAEELRAQDSGPSDGELRVLAELFGWTGRGRAEG